MGRLRIPHKETAQLVRRIVAQGCDVRLTRGGHLRVTLAGRYVTTMPQTPSDWRGLRNTRAGLRRAGIDPD